MGKKDTSGLDDALDKILQQYGPDSLMRGVEDPRPVPRLKTGSPELDYATGGGIPIGRMSRVWGGPSAGKSLLGWRISKVAQSPLHDMTVVLYDIEKQYDPHFVKAIGVNVGKLIVVQGTVIEEIAAKCEALLPHADLHIFDSASSAVSTEELAADPSSIRPGAQARAWGAAFKRIMESFDSNRNTLLVLDQARVAFGGNGRTEHPPGGRFIEHTSSCTIHLRKGAWLFRDPKTGLLTPDAPKKGSTMSETIEPDGQEVIARVDKARVARPLLGARMYYDYAAKGFDISFEVFKAGVFFEVIERSGSWYTMPDRTRHQGEMAARLALSEDPSMCEMILNYVEGQE